MSTRTIAIGEIYGREISEPERKVGKLRPTAAMMAGVVNTLWSFDRFFETVRQ